MHPSDFLGKRVRVRTFHEEWCGVLREISDWGLVGGGDYLVLESCISGQERVIAVSMRHIEVFEPTD